MGTKVMRFSNMEGDAIAVSFHGTGVSDGDLLPAVSPVVLQMDGGGGEYAAVKYTTASVAVLCDGVQHLDLYASVPLAVSVRVYNETTDKVLFLGYVTPNTFAQPIDGVNDTLTIECVDLLGISKYIPFDVGLDKLLTLAEVFEEVATRLGVPENWFVARNVRLTSGNGGTTTHEYHKLTIASRFFYDGITPASIGGEAVSLLPKAMTIYDALAMLAESFRATWLQVGDALVLFDEVVCREAGAAYYIGPLDWNAQLGGRRSLSEDDFAATGSTISVLPRYSTVSLARKQSKELAVMPDVLSDALLYRDGELVKYHNNKGSSNESMAVVQPLSSHVAAVGTGAAFLSYAELQRPAREAFSDAWQIGVWGDDHKWQNYLRVPVNDDGSQLAKLSMAVAPEYLTTLPHRSVLGLRLKVSVAFTNDTSRLYPYNIITSDMRRLLATLTTTAPDGTKLYYNGITEQWVDYGFINELEFPAYLNNSNEWRDAYVMWSIGGAEHPTRYPLDDIFAPGMPGGRVELSLYAPAKDGENWRVAYVKELSLQAVVVTDVRAACTADAAPEVEYRGTYDFNNTMETVELPIDVRVPLGDRFFGTVIDDTELLSSRAPGATELTSKRWEVGLAFDDGRGGSMSMLERVEAMAKCGDGMQYELTLADPHNSAYTPLTSITSPVWQGGKVIAGYSRDLYNSSIKVTLN